MNKIKLALMALLFATNNFAFDHKHTSWNSLLQKHTIKKNNQVLVQYKEIKKQDQYLNTYLKQLESVTKDQFKTFNQKQKLAFWINAYNAYTLKLIVKNYPIKSIKEIKKGWFSSGPWDQEFITLLGSKISLDHIEHKIVRKQFNEPRVHFALNCASVGCPSLYQKAFIAKDLEQQLQLVAQAFLQNKNKNYLKDNTLYLSKIFKWYGSDFDKKHKSFTQFIIKNLHLPQKKYNINFNEYDWSLNQY